MGDESLRRPINHLLDGAQAEGNLQDGVAEVLHEPPRGAVHTPEFSYERRQAWAVAGGVWARDVRLEERATAYAVGLVQQKMGDLYGDGGQFDNLMGVGEPGGGKLPLATGT